MPSTTTRFLNFQSLQGGILPPNLAAEYLGMTRQAVNAAANAGKLEFQNVAGTNYYGLKSLRLYKEFRTAKRQIERGFFKGEQDS